jgi:hypothetical protein
MIDEQAIQVGIPTPVTGPLADKLRELRGLPTDAPESDIYDKHPGVACLTGEWTRAALELARVGNEMLAEKDAELSELRGTLAQMQAERTET